MNPNFWAMAHFLFIFMVIISILQIVAKFTVTNDLPVYLLQRNSKLLDILINGTKNNYINYIWVTLSVFST